MELEGMLKHAGVHITRDFAPSPNVCMPKNKNKPVDYIVKHTNVNLGLSASEMIMKESAPGNVTLRRIKGESSLRNKMKKMFKNLSSLQLECEARSNRTPKK